MDDPKRLYECMLDYCSATRKIERIGIGQVWTVCQTKKLGKYYSGLAMSPAVAVRTLKWSGELSGKSLKDVARGILEWEPFQATVAMSVLNCSINNNRYIPEGQLLDVKTANANLTVFEHFLPRLKEQKVVVIGHYPGIEPYVEQFGWQVLERMPQLGDLPDTACEFLLPEADWVFLSASAIINKTFPRLAELSRNAKTVLMGPTVPWLPELYEFGIDYLAGVEVYDGEALFRTAIEGGGVRIFETAVRYKLVELTPQSSLDWLKQQISDTCADKEALTMAMNNWYTNGKSQRFPQYEKLNATNVQLSRLDSTYKKLWDNHNGHSFAHLDS